MFSLGEFHPVVQRVSIPHETLRISLGVRREDRRVLPLPLFERAAGSQLEV